MKKENLDIQSEQVKKMESAEAQESQSYEAGLMGDAEQRVESIEAKGRQNKFAKEAIQEGLKDIKDTLSEGDGEYSKQDRVGWALSGLKQLKAYYNKLNIDWESDKLVVSLKKEAESLGVEVAEESQKISDKEAEKLRKEAGWEPEGGYYKLIDKIKDWGGRVDEKMKVSPHKLVKWLGDKGAMKKLSVGSAGAFVAYMSITPSSVMGGTGEAPNSVRSEVGEPVPESIIDESVDIEAVRTEISGEEMEESEKEKSPFGIRPAQEMEDETSRLKQELIKEKIKEVIAEKFESEPSVDKVAFEDPEAISENFMELEKLARENPMDFIEVSANNPDLMQRVELDKLFENILTETALSGDVDMLGKVVEVFNNSSEDFKKATADVIVLSFSLVSEDNEYAAMVHMADFIDKNEKYFSIDMRELRQSVDDVFSINQTLTI